jgi:hypothetical protein
MAAIALDSPAKWINNFDNNGDELAKSHFYGGFVKRSRSRYAKLEE